MAEWAENQVKESPGGNIVEIIGLTDIGRVRQNNEDNFLIADLNIKHVPGPSQYSKFAISERGTLLLVSDGMGGRNAGEVASQIAVEVFQNELLNREYKQIGTEVLAEITKKANWAIWSRAQRNPQEQGMGATLTALLIEGSRAHIVQVGDSRAYVVRNERIFRLTKDQSMVQTLIDSGIIQPEEAETHPYRHVILQSLGAEPTVYPVTSTIDLYDGDWLLVCSDGLSGMLKDELLQDLILNCQNLEVGCRSLLDAANAHGGKDNITLILASLAYSAEFAENEPLESGAITTEIEFGNRTYSYLTPTSKLPPSPLVPEPESPPPAPSYSQVAQDILPSQVEDISAPVAAYVPNTGTKERVLVLCANHENLLSLEFMLKPYYEVITAIDGEEGLAKAITEHPRLIIAMVELPKITGMGVCITLRANPRFRNIPIILTSSEYIQKKHIIEGLENGADDYLVMPVDEKEILLRMKPYIERAKQMDTLRYESAVNEANNLQLQMEMDTLAKTRQEIFQNVLDVASDGVLIMDTAGWVTAVNETFIQFHKIQRETVVGFGYRALLKKIQHLYENPEQQLQRFNELINNSDLVAEDEVKIRVEKRGLTKIKRYSSPVKDESGKIYGRLFVFRSLVA
jgi:serine/threonine protein phosphatase PrpC/CheY-like chemotaxis protein